MVPTTQKQTEQKPNDPLAKALADAEFWRTNFEKQELESKANWNATVSEAVKIRVAELQQAHNERIAKLNTDIEFWRKGYTDIEGKHAAAVALADERAQRLSSADTKLVALMGNMLDITDDRNRALTLLRSLAAHVAGRDGMLQQSRIFCTKCEGAGRCMLREVYEFLGE